MFVGLLASCLLRQTNNPILRRATTQCLCRLFIRQAAVSGLAIRRDEILLCNVEYFCPDPADL